jgi:hypothetical protein
LPFLRSGTTGKLLIPTNFPVVSTSNGMELDFAAVPG